MTTTWQRIQRFAVAAARSWFGSVGTSSAPDADSRPRSGGYIPFVDADANRPPVEVTLTKQCPHGCSQIFIGSETVWHIPGLEPVSLVPNGVITLHSMGCAGDGEDCLCDDDLCWGEEQAHTPWDN